MVCTTLSWADQAGNARLECKPREAEGCLVWVFKIYYITSLVVWLCVGCGFSCWSVMLCGTTSTSLQQWCRHVLKTVWLTHLPSPLLGTPQVCCKASWSAEISTTTTYAPDGQITSMSIHSSFQNSWIPLLKNKEQFGFFSDSRKPLICQWVEVSPPGPVWSLDSPLTKCHLVHGHEESSVVEVIDHIATGISRLFSKQVWVRCLWCCGME